MYKDEAANEGIIKLLHKKHRVMDKPNIKTLFQFCDHDPSKTQKILIVAKDISNPYSIIKILNKKPLKAQQFLASLENRYDKQYGNVLEKEKKQQCHIIVSDLDFFRHLPVDACLTILTYLDPYTFSYFSQTSKKINKISQHNAISEYFRNLCLQLFPINSVKVPDPCKFIQVRKYVLAHPAQFSPNTRNAVLNNLQYYVWKQNPKALQVDKEYYLNYGSYLNIFKNCPRIHFNGYYICKHKYLKNEDKKLLQNTANSYLVQYYRYFRFFSDGSVLSEISSNKVKQQRLVQNLTVKNLQDNITEEKQEILVGQFRQHKEDVYVKVVKGNSLFNYHLKIESSKGRISNHLILIKYTLQLIDENQIIQTLQENTEEKQPLFFSYKKCNAMKKQNTKPIKACSL